MYRLQIVMYCIMALLLVVRQTIAVSRHIARFWPEISETGSLPSEAKIHETGRP